MSAQPGPGGRQDRIEPWRAASWIAGIIALVDGGAMIAAATVVVAAVVRDRPIDGLTYAYLPLVPILAAGQLWMLAQMSARRPVRRSDGRRTSFPIRSGSFPPRRQRVLFFGDLYPVLAYLLLACFAAGWLAAGFLNPGIEAGSPAGGHLGCPYALSNHGSITCVTQAIYQHAGASRQRFVGGIVFSFLSLHFGAALGSLTFFRTRDPASTDRRSVWPSPAEDQSQ